MSPPHRIPSYGLKPYRKHGQRKATLMLEVVANFADIILWPEFTQLAEALRAYLDEATERIIQEEVYKDTAEADEK
jgi:hypothetical protein